MITTKPVLHFYINGDYKISLHKDGSLIRETFADDPKAAFPTSIDIKITDYCDMGCNFCHEQSTTKGKHADLTKLLDVLNCLPGGQELALGGGNPLSHPELMPFLQELKRRYLFPNLTVNQAHLPTYLPLLKNLIDKQLVYGIGISITNLEPQSKAFQALQDLCSYSPNIVFHVIAGIHCVHNTEKLLEFPDPKILVLGYKQFGFGVDFYESNTSRIQSNIKKWYQYIAKYINKCTLSFDNLAIEQLNIRRLFTDKGWETFYMGDDGQFTCYIDAVLQKYAKTSRNADRISFTDMTLFQFFNSLHH